jgi:dTDP-glucose 4,6-dehydratase
MTVLVTGASGFLGAILMSRNPEFLGIDLVSVSERVDVCDVRDESVLQEYLHKNDVSEIVHLAGVQFNSYIRKKDRAEFFIQNIKMANSICGASELLGIRKVVYVSTDMVYGDKITKPISEEFTPLPIGEYGSSKLQAESILSEGLKNCDVVIFRPRLILGKGRVGTIQKLAKLIESPLPILLIGNGKNKYQFVAVEDVCSAIELALKSKSKGVFNIGSDSPPNLDDLFKSTLSNLNRNKRIFRIPLRFAILAFNLLDRMGMSPLTPEQYRIAGLDFILDTQKVKSVFGWSPTKNDETMLFESLSNLLDSN